VGVEKVWNGNSMDIKKLERAGDGCREGMEWAFYGHIKFRKGW